MRSLKLVAALLVAGGAAFAQLDSYTVTITASRTLNVQPDQAVIGVSFETALSAGLDDVLLQLQGSAITASDLTGVSTLGNSQQPMNDWTFTLTVPLSGLNSTLIQLSKLQQTINSGFSYLDFNVQGLQVSPQLQAAQTCPLPELMTDARAQGLKLAQAAGFGLGPVLAISDGSAGSYRTSSSVGYVPIPTVYFVLTQTAYPQPYLNLSSLLGFLSQTSLPACQAVVKFGLTPGA